MIIHKHRLFSMGLKKIILDEILMNLHIFFNLIKRNKFFKLLQFLFIEQKILKSMDEMSSRAI